MIKTSLLNYVAEVNKAAEAKLAKFNEGIANGHILHTLQWQTYDVAFAIHEQAKAKVLAVVAEKYEGVALVREVRRLHESLTRTLIINARGHNSTNPVSNQIDQAETHASAKVLEKLDEILRYDEEVQHATDDARVKALNVIALDPKIAKWLQKNDPQALKQVNEARDIPVNA